MSRNRKSKDKEVLSNKAKKKRLAQAKARKNQVTYTHTKAEKEEATTNQVKKALKQRKQLSRNPLQTILDIFDDNLDKPIPYRSKFWAIKEIATNSRSEDSYKKAAKRLLLVLEQRKCKFFETPNYYDYITLIKALASRSDEWIRQPENWRCKSKNITKQFRDLIRYLFAKYDVPLFFDKAWIEQGKLQEQRWWVFIAKGGNLRKAQNLPITLTKKMAHHIMQAPEHYTIDAAFRWGQIHALGGNQRNADALLDTFLCQGHFRNDDFWQSVFRFFINNPMLDPSQYGPITDYLRNQKFITPEGAQTPPQPNLSVKDRNADTLMGQVEDWHNQLARIARKQTKRPKTWEHHPVVEDFVRLEGKKDNKTEYRITQLLSASDLLTEGRRLNHCVGSYAWSCANGTRSIWSVRKMTTDGWECLGTIELNNGNGSVVQFRAKRNSSPSLKATTLLNYWTRENGLSIATWI